MNSEQLFYYNRDYATELKRSYIQYIIGMPVYNIIDAADAELVLNDNNLITKGDLYRFLQPFLKSGLLTSTGKHWHSRRKLLTPAFHFKILEQFLEVFKQESVKFIDLLQNMSTNTVGPCEVNLNNVIPRFTLNSICETALGVRLDDCADGDEYRNNITIAEHSFINRVINPLLGSDTLYNNFGNGRKDIPTLKNLHAFSSNIIKKRRQNFNREAYETESSDLNTKQRYAMLDTMLLAEMDGLIDHAGICEEVDTFMFEGFDTTSMNIILALAYLASHPNKQQLCYEEITQFISNNGELNDLDSRTLGQLKYLECVIKETQRLCPSVPSIMRECHEDTKLANNLIMPKGTQIIVHIFDIHRNPLYFEEPNEFIPERFLPENSTQRHPFAFIPFSAGRRNCIGQKFAMLEVKTLLVYILSHFMVLPVSNPKDYRYLAGILIRTKEDVFIKITKRKN
ncbi:GH21738 [Drosophila grimshawi]|uniref:GH21738 n=2 Tax=Drosophila grimshawi TaxID=7222 RepID=B4J6H8_DROGR|nr:GH21738 [Drosophila grimshawi]